MNLIHNIINNYNYLQKDYIGTHFNISVISNLVINIAISLCLIVIFYLLGSKIKNMLIKKEKFSQQEIFIKIALGYIFIGSGLALLGLFSLLYSAILSIYIILIILISLFPLKSIGKNLSELSKFKKGFFNDFKTHKWIFIWVTLFIIIGFIKLQSPEIREDQYHTDLPVRYLKSHTTMLPSKEQIMVSASPQLSEMSYLIAIFIGSKEAARYIHFIFYILVLLLLYSFSKDKKYKFMVIAPLIFATAPEVMHEMSSQYTDFQWIFLFLLSVFILIKDNKLTKNRTIMSGILFGGMIATKLWTIAFLPIPILYIIIGNNNNKPRIALKKSVLTFAITSALVPSIWFLRSLILTGDPVYPAFINRETLEGAVNLGISHYFGFNHALFDPSTLKQFSPIFFLGIIFMFYNFKGNLKDLRKIKLGIFFVLLTILYLSINYPYPRYLLGLYVIAIMVISLGLYKITNKIPLIKYLVSALLFLIFIYYFINSLLILPYGIGFADKNNYLTRTLSKDNSSYYDFNHSFNKFIKKSDLVATYGVFGFYYANFNYIDINYIFSRNNRNFRLLKKEHVSKLFIKGGDINWFCSILKILKCKPNDYALLSSYSAVPYSAAKYYLYSIK